MKFSIFLTLTFCAFTCVSVYAQTGSVDLYINTETGRVWYDPSSSVLDSAVRNMSRQSQLQLANFNSMMTGTMVRSFIIDDAGKAKINLGKASTLIKYSAQSSIIIELSSKDENQTDQQKTKQAANIALQTFNSILKAKRFTAYDMADGKSLAFVLSFLVYNNQDPGETRMQKLRQYYKQEMLKSIVFQGTPDKEKQREYESLAVRTMLAIRGYQFSKNADLDTRERDSIIQTSKRYAESVLDDLWDEPVAGIELTNAGIGFGNKGERLIKTGGAITTFRNIKESAWAKVNATCYEKDDFTVIEGDISCFYDMRERFDQESKILGGQINDLAYANAVAFKLMYEVYKQVKLNQKQFNWVLSQMQNDIKTDIYYQNISDEQKQATYDSLVYRAMKIYDYYQKANSSFNKPKYQGYSEIGEGVSAINKMESAGTRAMSLLYDIFQPHNLSQYDLHEDGFVKVR